MFIRVRKFVHTIDHLFFDLSLTDNVTFYSGGTNVLQFAIGSDVTKYFIGDAEIDGIRHTHDTSAVRTLEKLIKWKLDGNDSHPQDVESLSPSNRRRSSINPFNNIRRRVSLKREPVLRRTADYLFINAVVLNKEVISGESSKDNKYIIKLRLGFPREDQGNELLGIPLPTSTFLFRENDFLKGEAFERPYSPVSSSLVSYKAKSIKSSLRTNLIRRSTSTSAQSDSMNMIAYDFIITIVPGGKMSSSLAKKIPGHRLMVKGPLVKNDFLERIERRSWSQVCVVVEGTGITPALQLIDHQLSRPDPPTITLVWLVKRRFEVDCIKGITNNTKNLRYVVIDSESIPLKSLNKDDDDDDDDDDDEEAKLEFMKRYHAHGITSKDTTEALLSWACSEETDDTLMHHKDKDVNRFSDLLVALCGHPHIEYDYPPVLQSIGINQDQIIRFPAGSMPLSEYMTSRSPQQIESVEESDLEQFEFINETDQTSDPSAIDNSDGSNRSFNSFMEFIGAPVSIEQVHQPKAKTIRFAVQHD